MKNTELYKYPRTKHLEGSNAQIGDSLKKFPYITIYGKYVVIEEKVDGAQFGVSFEESGDLLLQSRGHYLTGGYGERYFNYLKSFFSHRKWSLFEVLGSRYILYGENMYCKHTIFYNRLPSYFMEYDVYDKENGVFLSTSARNELLAPLRKIIIPVKVLFSGNNFLNYEQFTDLVTSSNYIDTNDIKSDFFLSCMAGNSDLEIEEKRTDLGGIMEGLYVKVEEGSVVLERYKWVRGSFTQTVLDSASHWQTRKIVRNRTCPDVQYV